MAEISYERTGISRRRATVTSMLGCVLLVPVLSAGPAMASGAVLRSGVADPFAADANPAVLEVMRQQDALYPAVRILESAIKGNDAGFTSIAFEGDGLALSWKGELPDAVAIAVQQARAIGPVQVKAARFSLAELESEAARLSKILEQNSDLQTLEIDPDGGGITIERLPADTRRRVGLHRGRELVGVATMLASAKATVPVKVTDAAAGWQRLACPPNCSRFDDHSPWNAGDFMNNRSNGWHCSSGFGVWAPGYQEYFVLTAAHCGSNAETFEDFQLEAIGWVLIDDWDRDVAALRAPGWYWMWDGTSTSTVHKTVHSWDYPVTNELLCQSGYHGVVCNLKTQSGRTWTVTGCDSDNDCYTMHNFSKAVQLDGVDAAVGGDSGGPVFSLDGNGVRAKGLVSATRANVVNGPGVNLLFQDMNDIVDRNLLYPRTA
jgi:hypothetical protein